MASDQIEILHTRSQLLAVRDEWEMLWARSEGAYFLNFSSCLHSWDLVHQPQGRRLYCAILRQDGRIVAILPLVCQRRALWTIALALGPEAAEGCDILVEKNAAAGIGTQILQRFIAAARPDIMNFAFVVAGSALDVAIKASRKFHVVTQVDPMPYAVLRDEQTWAAFEKTVSKSYQQQTRRKLRRLEEKGVVAFEVIHGAADASIDWLLDEKQKWGVKVGKLGSWLFSPQYRAYLKALTESDDRILTFVLKLDGVPIAVKVIVAGPILCTLIIGAYDEDQSYFSPGSILDEFWIKHVFDHYCDAEGRKLDVNFGVGLERYKTHWGRGHAMETASYKLAASTWGEIPYRVKGALNKIRTRPIAKPVQDAV